ncbi:hypothetical protein ACSFA2_17275 [Variovorax sp. LT2P21]|uniref:hypothetical protein n=1 Tax=Variovorax sp. LT2P21 TaxID=3443731 RepID=UPI003F487C81
MVTAVSLPVWAQTGRYEGTWDGTFFGVNGAPRTGTVVVRGQTGEWKMDAESRTNPCVGMAAPIALRDDGPDSLSFEIQRSKALAGCPDTVMHLRRNGVDGLIGMLNKRPFELTRKTPDSLSPAKTGAAPLAATGMAVPPNNPAQTEPKNQMTSAVSAPAGSSARVAPTRVEMIYFGGNDCPPCVAWRGVELPKLKNMEAFRNVDFTHVYKTVMSTVPAETFLPDHVKPYKSKLDAASGLNRGSAQTAIVVDGEIFDYYYGTRSAEDIAERLVAIKRGGAYPYERCLELRNGYNATRGQCVRPVAPS